MSSPPQLMSVAPMMEWTDVHFRQLARMLSERTWLWTEMVVDKTIIHTPQPDKHLWFPPEQHPIVCQMGGSDPDTLAQAAKVVASYGYDEINLNCGCPSDRVAGAGCFGASLMLQPEVVGACMAAIAEASGLPVNVKCRLGVDEEDSYQQLHAFVQEVSTLSPTAHFIVHSRKCFLAGLNPHENRTVPPLRYEWVYALQQDFPHLAFSLNGGVQSNEGVRGALAAEGGDGAKIHGVMIGRAAYNDPWGVLSDADRGVFGAPSNPAPNRRVVLERYCAYADAMIARWGTKEDGHRDPSVRALMKPLLNLFHGEPRNKRWKTAVDTALKEKPRSVREVLDATLHLITEEVLDAPPRQGDALSPWELGPRPTMAARAGFNQGPPGTKETPRQQAAQQRRRQQQLEQLLQQQQQQELQQGVGGAGVLELDPFQMEEGGSTHAARPPPAGTSLPSPLPSRCFQQPQQHEPQHAAAAAEQNSPRGSTSQQQQPQQPQQPPPQEQMPSCSQAPLIPSHETRQDPSTAATAAPTVPKGARGNSSSSGGSTPVAAESSGNRQPAHQEGAGEGQERATPDAAGGSGSGGNVPVVGASDGKQQRCACL